MGPFPHGRIKIESDDDMRKRGLPSPDRADTLAMVMSRRATGGLKVHVESHQGEEHHRRSHPEGLVRTTSQEEQVRDGPARPALSPGHSERSKLMQARWPAMETGRYFIDEAAHLLATLRLWAQSHYRTEQAVREILETLDTATLRDVAGQLRGMGGREAKTASATLATMARLPSAQLQAIAAYAFRAL